MNVMTNGITHRFEGAVVEEDGREHRLSVSCWCNPTIEGHILTHNCETKASFTSEYQLFRDCMQQKASRPHCRLFHQWSAWSELSEVDDDGDQYQDRTCWRCKRVDRHWID